MHRETSDRVFDQALLYVGNDVDYGGLMAIVEAISSTTRDVAVDGKLQRVPAIHVNLGMAPDMVLKPIGDPLAQRGRIPPEEIHRIVRTNFDRFRSCYEEGLAKNQSLIGTVRAKFVIDRNGKVTEVSDAGGTTLADAGVVDCILHEFGKLSFPRPDGGIVTVVYPIVFEVR